ncbi:complement factor H-like isoform X6 [Anguilla anguilla]|uniref:complement factor H-like isoform X6 n=1 Tax=Anguilla anguilla TaxID=7936 RepID=UPI0015A8DA2E|nr:complement factor H-like isoform X6 [Anguilla anguilla]
MQAVGYGCFLILWICFSAVAKAQNAITCDPKIPNAIILSGIKKYTLGERLDYECELFHEPKGKQETFCRESGWEKKPDCKGFCQRPVLENGYLIPDKSNPSVIHYGCIPGYTPSVDGWWGELTCTHSVWSDNPKCIASDKMCNPPPHVEYATITSKYKTKYTHLSKVEFQCTELYEIEGNREVTCRHGTWSAVPKCIRSKCSSPEDKVNNAVLVHKKEGPYENGAKVDYECEDTFIPGDESKAICINGQWKYPHCTNYCEKPDLPNGYVESPKKTYMEGEMLEYRCYSPCEPKTNNSITCKNGQWDGQVECICPQKTCQKPPVPENGDIVSTEVENGETVVTYQCKLHYKLKDERKVRCHEGEWEPFPVCIDYCEKPDLPNGYVESPKKTYMEGEMLEYRCYSPCEPKTKNSITCKNGQWDGQVECICPQKTCQKPPVPENGDIVSTEVENGETVVTYQCKLHYKLKDERKVRCHEGEWEPFPVCIDYCEKPDLPNGYVESPKKTYMEGEMLEYRCYSPCEPKTKNSITCKNGQWDGQVECICPQKTCPKPPVPENGDIVSTEVENGETVVTYQCKLQYKLKDERKVRCHEGEWEPFPVCIDYCEKPDLPNGYVESPKKTYMEGEMLEYRCYSPCEPKTKNSITCKNGQWDGQVECICPQKTCQKPPVPENGDIVSTEVENGETVVTYQCKLHYKLKDERKVRCHEGEWEPFPVCIDYCEKPDLPNGYVESPKKTYMEGEMLEYRCYSPCEPKTKNSITCKNGQWDGQVECICPQKTCPKPPVPENGDIVSTEVENGETVVTYQCKLQYKLKDERKVRCHEGEWEPFPVCIGPCVIEQIHPKYNLRDLKVRTYVLEGKKIKIKCKYGYYINIYWDDEVEVKCEDGEITGYKSCQHYTKIH